MTFLNDKKFNWQKHKEKNTSLFIKGKKSFALRALDTIRNITNTEELSLALTNHLEGQDDFTGGIIETPTHLIAWADHIRSWPLYYSAIDDDFILSNNALLIQEAMKTPSYNADALTEFKLSGFITGKNTLVDDVFCLSPGEFIIWDKQKKTLHKAKYFSYTPSFDRKITEEEAIKKLNLIFDDLTTKIIARANGKTIYMPLSGGLDSRILLCKLHEHGYRNIKTFTYGPRLNFEGFIAKRIAATLDIPWRFVSIPRKTLKTYFDSNDRKAFWNFAGNLKTIPCMREYSAIRYLHESKFFKSDGIFLNGQSGDYITGGHLSSKSKNKPNYTTDDFYDVVINKHYDLWKQHKTPKNIEIIKAQINQLLIEETGKPLTIKNNIDGAIAEETWEYAGRQICYVANGQRVYEYFGYDWEMPLWEKQLVDFYQSLPFDMKYGQKIYKKYLQSYNYKNLFPAEEPYIWRWPIPMLWVVPVAQVVGLFGGRKGKDNFYARMKYHGHYANQYAFFNRKEYLTSYKDSRSVVSLFVKKWFIDNNLPF